MARSRLSYRRRSRFDTSSGPATKRWRRDPTGNAPCLSTTSGARRPAGGERPRPGDRAEPGPGRRIERLGTFDPCSRRNPKAAPKGTATVRSPGTRTNGNETADPYAATNGSAGGESRPVAGKLDGAPSKKTGSAANKNTGRERDTPSETTGEMPTTHAATTAPPGGRPEIRRGTDSRARSDAPRIKRKRAATIGRAERVDGGLTARKRRIDLVSSVNDPQILRKAPPSPPTDRK